MTTDPDIFMREALAEAVKGLGLTAPNPAVGAVVVKNGKIIGRGFHAKAGTPHAEPIALREAGAAAKGADLYVTLEPCCTHGRTPPCTDAILAAGIRRVFIGCLDPNPAHAGRGPELLRAAGIEVTTDLLEPECRRVIRGFARVQECGLPFVTLKLACTLDGRIADARGRSQWISGPASRERVQALRREADAILVGTETLRKDNPSLTPRPAEGRSPLRLVPDRRGRLTLSLKVFTDGGPTLCLLGPEAPAARRRSLDALGVAWTEVPVRREHIQWTLTFRQLAQRGIHHILCEGGGQLAAALLRANLVQELQWIVAPKLLGENARPAVAQSWTLANAPEFQLQDVTRLGDDVWLRLGAG
jgi:diaminohydroxyphosphoribosylaminopyrimidine deaminase/5-amino-6-(5-phosphoribosylamino)uracil reductase